MASNETGNQLLDKLFFLWNLNARKKSSSKVEKWRIMFLRKKRIEVMARENLRDTLNKVIVTETYVRLIKTWEK